MKKIKPSTREEKAIKFVSKWRLAVEDLIKAVEKDKYKYEEKTK